MKEKPKFGREYFLNSATPPRALCYLLQNRATRDTNPQRQADGHTHPASASESRHGQIVLRAQRKGPSPACENQSGPACRHPICKLEPHSCLQQFYILVFKSQEGARVLQTKQNSSAMSFHPKKPPSFPSRLHWNPEASHCRSRWP